MLIFLTQLGQPEKALGDAEKCISLAPHWAKGHGRKGAALLGMGDFHLAAVAIKRGAFDKILKPIKPLVSGANFSC